MPASAASAGQTPLRWLLCVGCDRPVGAAAAAVTVRVQCLDCLDRSNPDSTLADAIAASPLGVLSDCDWWRARASRWADEQNPSVTVALDQRPVAVGDVLWCRVRGAQGYMTWTGQHRVTRVDTATMTAKADEMPRSAGSEQFEDPVDPAGLAYFDERWLGPNHRVGRSTESYCSWMRHRILEHDKQHLQAEQALAEAGDLRAQILYCPRDEEWDRVIERYLGTDILKKACTIEMDSEMEWILNSPLDFVDRSDGSDLPEHDDVVRRVDEHLRVWTLGALHRRSEVRATVWRDIVKPYLTSQQHRLAMVELRSLLDEAYAADSDGP